MNIQEEIVKWAEKTVREYHEIASRKEVNLHIIPNLIFL